MDPPKFKRRRVSAVRDFPIIPIVVSSVQGRPIQHGVLDPALDPALESSEGREEIAQVHVHVSYPVLRKYPPPKFRKGVTVTRDFPVGLKAPATSFCDIHACIKSEEDGFKESNLSMVVGDQQNALDVPIANNIHVTTDFMDYKLSNPPNAADVRDFHESIKPKKEGVEESSSLINVRDEQCEAGFPIANDICASTSIKDSKPRDFRNATDVHDNQIKSNKKDVEKANSLRLIGDKQCQAIVYSLGDYQVPITDEKLKNLSSLTKEASTPIVVADDRCPGSLFGVHDFQAPNDKDCVKVHDSQAFNDDDEECVKKTLMEVNDSQVGPSNDRYSGSLFGVHDFQAVDDKDCVKVHDSQASFNDEECVKTTLMEVNDSQVGASNDEVITNNELRKHREKVKEIIHLFREVYNELLRDNGGKPKGSFSCEAASTLLKRYEWIKKEKDFGPISGVEVGDYFDWRAELCIIGLHFQYFHGIDHVKQKGKYLATSVVDSRRYDNVFESNDGEFSDTLMYLGEGENPKVRSKKSIGDQKLVKGNLALKNSAEAKTPIRVIRKVFFKCGKIEKHKYVYDGLYFVDSYGQEIAPSGKHVFKFLLKRFSGQPKLDWKELIRKLGCMKDISQGEERAPICVEDAGHHVIDDISQGKERIPIRAMNDLDDEKPPVFNYVIDVTYPKTNHPSVIDDCCDCIDGCSDSEDCPCIIKSGGLTYNDEELLMKAKPLIVECGPSCKCLSSCINRVSQRGIRLPLEVFKTKTKGWGVRSRSFIPRGSFICEYIGEVVRDMECEERIGKDDYLFDIGVNRGDLSSGEECFTIDAARVGNVGRFINHSCSPNLFAQEVLFDHDNKRMPHIMLFSKKDIPPLEELTYHYNYSIGGVCDANGNIKIKPCHCGSSKCTGRMY